MNEIKRDKKDVTTKILIGLVSLMLVAIAVMGYMLHDLSKRNKMAIGKTQDVTKEKDNLKQELSLMYDDYSLLETSNDSLNSEIEMEKERIMSLIEELENVKNYSYNVQQKYEKELASLRTIMRHYVYQIDSLDQMNKILIAENIMVKQDHSRIKTEMDEVVEKNTELETTIEVASVIKTSNIQIGFLNRRGKETEKSTRIEKVKVSFNFVGNDLAEAGPRRVYLRIIRPDGYAMTKGQTFEFREKQIAYSAYRDIIYNNKDLAVVIFYDIEETVLLGKYTVELFMSGEKVGQSVFSIEK
ncbi:MAG: hypothetical protein PHE33_03845 [Bacteroidales bacterium]|nr:hypothetical protein [Bacteroidales bacterium]